MYIMDTFAHFGCHPVETNNDLGRNNIRQLGSRDKVRCSLLLRKGLLLEIVSEPDELLLAEPRTHERESESVRRRRQHSRHNDLKRWGIHTVCQARFQSTPFVKGPRSSHWGRSREAR